MIPPQWTPVANHLWQSTLFSGAAVLLAFALKRNPAKIRCRIWLAASLKFLVPFSLLLNAGSRIEWRDVKPIAVPVAVFAGQISQPFDTALPVAEAPSIWPPILLALWILGSLAVALRWMLRWRRMRFVLRGSRPWRRTLSPNLPVRIAHTTLEPGVFGVFRPVLLLPAGIEDRLSLEELSAILAHESFHVRHRDNLFAALHMLVESVFWFHPLVWWIGARLVEEREHACDEAVLLQGRDPQAYAAGILKVCRFYLESPLPCAPGVTGADLTKRIAAIMNGKMANGLTLSKKLLLVFAGLTVIAAPVAIGILKAQPPATHLRFEVASIRPAKSGGQKGGLELLPGGGLRMDGVTLKMLIAMAYDVRESQIAGVRNWMGSETFNISAKAEDPEPADNPGRTVAPGTVAWNRMCLRLRTLVEERFRLVYHETKKEQSGYLLVVAKGGPKLQESADQGNARTMRAHGQIDARRGTMAMLATVLSNFLEIPVVDRTGLTGTYDYKLEYSEEQEVSTQPSLFTALQEQLGLRLDSSKVATVTFVIDRAQRPSEN